jgi:hypothetical protein
MSKGSTHIRSFVIGSFYAGYFYVFDRTVHLKGVGNVSALVFMSVLALIITIGTIKVYKNSAYHMPLKPLTLLAAFIIGMAIIYGFFGTMPGQENFLEQLAATKTLPPALQHPLEKFVRWGAQHSLIGAKQP